MHRLAIAVVLLLSTGAVAQNSPSSDPYAISLAQKSVSALAAGATISDVTLNANVISILGSDYETGTGTFKAKGTAESRVDLNLSKSKRSDVRNLTNGVPAGAWEKNGGSPTAYAQHNCWTDAPWFFPVLSSLAQTANSNFVFNYIGQEQHAGVSTQHIRVYQAMSGVSLMQHLSTVDFYLDPASFLPLAAAFQIHPDSDAATDLQVEVRFAGYQRISGVNMPFHIQRLLDGCLVLDIVITNAVFNTGLPDTVFIL